MFFSKKEKKILKNLYDNIIRNENIKINVFKSISIYYIWPMKINNNFKK